MKRQLVVVNEVLSHHHSCHEMILKLASCHVVSVLHDGKVRNALPEDNIAPENINKPLEKEIPIGNPPFLGAT